MPSLSLHPTFAKIGNEIVAQVELARCHARPLLFCIFLTESPPSSSTFMMVARVAIDCAAGSSARCHTARNQSIMLAKPRPYVGKES